MSEIRPTPPLSPVLLAGFLLRPLPASLLQPPMDIAASLLARRHPGLFDRLAPFAGAVVVIDPTDLPFRFALHLHQDGARVRVVADAPVEGASATIHAPLLALIDLLEGRIDGDALFFARDLHIEGDTEVVVALRNAVDGEEISVAGLALSVLGPAAAPARHAIAAAGRVLARFADDLETVRAAALAPALGRIDTLAADLRRVREQIETPAKGRGR